MGIVYGEMQPSALFSLHRLTHNQIGNVDDIPQLAQLPRRLAAFEKGFGLLIKDIKPVPYRTIIWFTSFSDWFISTISSG